MGYFEDLCWEESLGKYSGPAYVEKNQLENMGCFCYPNRCMNFLSVPGIGKGLTSCESFNGFTGAVWNLDRTYVSLKKIKRIIRRQRRLLVP